MIDMIFADILVNLDHSCQSCQLIYLPAAPPTKVPPPPPILKALVAEEAADLAAVAVMVWVTTVSPSFKPPVILVSKVS